MFREDYVLVSCVRWLGLRFFISDRFFAGVAGFPFCEILAFFTGFFGGFWCRMGSNAFRAFFGFHFNFYYNQYSILFSIIISIFLFLVGYNSQFPKFMQNY